MAAFYRCDHCGYECRAQVSSFRAYPPAEWWVGRPRIGAPGVAGVHGDYMGFPPKHVCSRECRTALQNGGHTGLNWKQSDRHTRNRRQRAEAFEQEYAEKNRTIQGRGSQGLPKVTIGGYNSGSK